MAGYHKYDFNTAASGSMIYINNLSIKDFCSLKYGENLLLEELEEVIRQKRHM